jgi:hypothetical protein
MRKSLIHAFAGLMAAASLTAFAKPTYAGTSEQNDVQTRQGWCDVVPPFCGDCNDFAARRCRPNPCQITVKDRNIREQAANCPAVRED